MKIGLIGLPFSGKTTVFSAVTGIQPNPGSYAPKSGEPNIRVVKVADERVDKLARIYRPKKVVYATVEFADFAGMEKGETKTPFSTGIAAIKRMDALGLVLKNFNMSGEDPDPVGDLKKILEELILTDLITAEQRLERIEHALKRGQKTDALLSEQKCLKRVHEALDSSLFVRDVELERDEKKLIRGFQFLTEKPMMIILNSAEELFGREALVEELSAILPTQEFAGKFEMELAGLDDPEMAKDFMEEMGIKKSAMKRLVKTAYDILGYISFFTVGADEVRAWQLKRGSTALKAARTIHSDMERGFIRAECFTYEDLVRFGSEKEIKSRGRFRLEGKGYLVEDGDILCIRFNV